MPCNLDLHTVFRLPRCESWNDFIGSIWSWWRTSMITCKHVFRSPKSQRRAITRRYNDYSQLLPAFCRHIHNHGWPEWDIECQMPASHLLKKGNNTKTNMTLSRGKLEEALIQGTYQVFTSDPDATTVNKVRKHVEDAQNLQAGFFASDEWKQRSKILIKEYVVSNICWPGMHCAVHRGAS